MLIPRRKCYQAVKVTSILLLVVTVLGFIERWRGGRRTVSAYMEGSPEAEYERQILEDESRIIPGLGEGGEPVEFSGVQRVLGEESEKKLAMNVYLSDRIPYNRSIQDRRAAACSRVVYDAELPSASVILIFHNEPYSVLVRTIWSVVNSARRNRPWFASANYRDKNGRNMQLGYPGQDPNSEFVYLKEVILVDDASNLTELGGKLSHYVRTRLPPGLVRLVRLPEREGLMSARTRGARVARGQVVVFLDAHCEAGADWLRPLLQRIKEKRTAVVTPLIDVIDQTNFQLDAADEFQVGGFGFTGFFTWVDVSQREKKRRGSEIAPTWSPTMAGGLFAVERAYFWELGGYDEQMRGWGGENLEMSFRIWQCGGSLETIPCSRVAHVFRAFHPYSLPAASDTHGLNTARLADVWMDGYRELFYMHRPDLRNNPKIGDITHRKILREKLQCKSFQWYLDNIYPEKFVPVRDDVGFGRFRNPGLRVCLDTLQKEDSGAPLGSYPCHDRPSATQIFSLTRRGQLRDEVRCADQHTRSEDKHSSQVVMINCGETVLQRHRWEYTSQQQLRHVASGLCMEASLSHAELRLVKCRAIPAQRWVPDYTDDLLHSDNDIIPLEQREILHSLRGQRRLSRSLQSLTESPVESGSVTPRSRKKHSRKKKRSSKKQTKSKVKNKFILRVERGGNLPGSAPEHLELEVLCRHRRLLPNDSFVRDLVAILNDHDIRVINNGRVFERNRVTELGNSRVLHKLDVERTAKEQQPVTEHDLRDGKDARTDTEATEPPTTVTIKPREHRIIVEEFVEVTPRPTHGTTKRPHKREHKKRRHRRPTTEKIDETTPMARRIFQRENDDVKRAQDSEELRQRYFIEEDAVTVARSPSSEEEPVKLVLRSNLTFNLGDEFFNWRRNDDTSGVVELSIPGSTTTAAASSSESNSGSNER